ncbi:hypothetical protein E8F11_14940 [Pseudomonas sp. BN417]|uniref:hypothetical protein n=1 Tax=Pseudomonas sp. BN417 TaxID=2567890 RepID=UPI0024548E56|nr:hypothetical protein [Pseudomonas sp. BN417]MDH4556451.1 hypothetical protein [Pseudomonas sp. BN417]
MFPNVLNKLMLTSLALAASLAWTNAYATCTPNHSNMEKGITLPASISIKAAKIGSARGLAWNLVEELYK